MFKYAIQFANTANSLPNWDFDNRYVGTANFQGIFGICITDKSSLSTRASDLYTRHILSLHFKFLLYANLMTSLELLIEFATITYLWIPIFEHYNCIANAFARCSNLVLSAMTVLFRPSVQSRITGSCELSTWGVSSQVTDRREHSIKLIFA